MRIDLQSIFLLAGFFIAAFIISSVTAKIRQQAKVVRLQETQVAMLYHLSKDLAAADSFDQVLNVIRINVGKILDCHVAIFLYADKKLELKTHDPDLAMGEKESAAASWAYEQDVLSGQGTNMYKDARCKYLPLKTSQGVFGVLGDRKSVV